MAATAAASQALLQQQAQPRWHQQPQTALLIAAAHAAKHTSVLPEQHLRLRRLAQDQTSGWKPSSDEKERSKTAGHFSAGHAALVSLLCLVAVGALGYSGYKAMQWYHRTKRPGYVELQSLETVFHRPGVF